MPVTPAAAIADPQLLGQSFEGRSWDRWRAVLKAAYAEPLSSIEQVLFREVAERDPPEKPIRELWAIVGRRGGKDSMAAGIATTAAMADYRRYLRPGERATVMCLAVDRMQSRIVLNYIRGFFHDNPLLKPLVRHETPDGLELTNDIEIVVATNSYRAVRGRTLLCVIFDEVAFWRSETSANPDEETYAAILPGLITLPNAMLIGISTAYRRSGLLFRKWREHYGRDDDDVLVVKGTSRDFNPLLPQSFIDAALERDPQVAGAEWLSEWRSDLADFIDRAIVEAAVVSGRFELPPARGTDYVAFVDPSGGSADSMTLAIAHCTGDDTGVLDALREVRPPFSPDAVVQEFAELLQRYDLASVTGDRYGGDWPGERFREAGIRYEASEHSKSELYRELLPLLNSCKVELLDHPRMINQLCSLERRVARGGRDSIDHPPGAHDDVANVAAGALVLATSGTSTLRLWVKLAG